MRYLLVSDIHANLAAFEAVLKDAHGQYEQVWCLGDVVGYGPDPNECVELLLTLDHISLAGNHDWGVLNKLDVNDFNSDARAVALWTREQLNTQAWDYLSGLPPAMVRDDIFTLVHASPRHPIWEYILSPRVAQPNFRHFKTPFCFIGHTHMAVMFRESADSLPNTVPPDYENNPVVPLSETRLIINPGSVGQPRDGDNRAAYGILDTETLTFTYHRIHYPVSVTQKKLKDAKLPESLWKRLALGW